MRAQTELTFSAAPVSHDRILRARLTASLWPLGLRLVSAHGGAPASGEPIVPRSWAALSLSISIRRRSAGVITKVAIQCAPLMRHTATALFAVSSFANVASAHALARQTISQALSAFEFLDAASMDLAVRHVPGARRFFDDEHAMYILVELAGAIRRVAPSRKPCGIVACMPWCCSGGSAIRQHLQHRADVGAQGPRNRRWKVLWRGSAGVRESSVWQKQRLALRAKPM